MGGTHERTLELVELGLELVELGLELVGLGLELLALGLELLLEDVLLARRDALVELVGGGAQCRARLLLLRLEVDKLALRQKVLDGRQLQLRVSGVQLHASVSLD